MVFYVRSVLHFGINLLCFSFLDGFLCRVYTLLLNLFTFLKLKSFKKEAHKSCRCSFFIAKGFFFEFMCSYSSVFLCNGCTALWNLFTLFGWFSRYGAHLTLEFMFSVWVVFYVRCVLYFGLYYFFLAGFL